MSDDVPLSDERRAAIRAWLGDISPDSAADEAMIYGEWAASQIDDAATVIDKLGAFLATRLTEPEKQDFVDQIRGIGSKPGPDLIASDQRLRRLRQKIGLEVH